MILFPETAVEAAASAADRVAMPDGTVLPRVTISMGVAELRDGMSVPDLLESADLAMYRAEQGGRNQVIVARPDELARGARPFREITVLPACADARPATAGDAAAVAVGRARQLLVGRAAAVVVTPVARLAGGVLAVR